MFEAAQKGHGGDLPYPSPPVPSAAWQAGKEAKFNNRNLAELHGNGCLREALSQKTPLLIVAKKKGELDAGSCSKKASTQLPLSPRLCLSLGQSPEPEDSAAVSIHGCPCTVLCLSPYVQIWPWGCQGCLLTRRRQERVQTCEMERLSGKMNQDPGQRGRK